MGDASDPEHIDLAADRAIDHIISNGLKRRSKNEAQQAAEIEAAEAKHRERVAEAERSAQTEISRAWRQMSVAKAKASQQKRAEYAEADEQLEKGLEQIRMQL